MDHHELEELVLLVEDEARSILENQLVLAEIKQEIGLNLGRLFEQDYIYRDQFGGHPSQPRTHVVAGVSITTQVLHQTGIGMRDIAGADLLYEIVGEKYALIQYKRPDHRALLQNDEEQIDELLSKCPSVCTYKRREPKLTPLRLNGYCGCWYNCVSDAGGRYVHACEAKLLFRGQKTISAKKFDSGLTRDEFDRLFAACRIGALTSIKPSDHYKEEQLSADHLVFHLKQGGLFKRPSRNR